MPNHVNDQQVNLYSIRQRRITQAVKDAVNVEYKVQQGLLTEIKSNDFVIYQDRDLGTSTGLYRVLDLKGGDSVIREADTLVPLVNAHGATTEAPLADLSPAPPSGVPTIMNAIALDKFEIYGITGIELPFEIKGNTSYYDVVVKTASFDHGTNMNFIIRETAAGRELDSISEQTKHDLDREDGDAILNAIVDMVKSQRRDLIDPRLPVAK